ncbi:hypothetical protein Btru_055828, partial [Bulinus truncatus]
ALDIGAGHATCEWPMTDMSEIEIHDHVLDKSRQTFNPGVSENWIICRTPSGTLWLQDHLPYTIWHIVVTGSSAVHHLAHCGYMIICRTPSGTLWLHDYLPYTIWHIVVTGLSAVHHLAHCGYRIICRTPSGTLWLQK